MGCLAIIIAILIGGFFDGVVIYLIWNILASIFALQHMGFIMALVIGIVFSLLKKDKD